MAPSRVAPVLLALLVAGCVGASVPVEAPTPLAAASVLHLDERAAAPLEPIVWRGATLTFSAADAGRCTPSGCEVKKLVVDQLPPGHWILQVGLDWADAHEQNSGDGDAWFPSFELAVRDATGKVLAEHPGTKFGDRVALADPAPGTYAIEVRIGHFMSDFQGYGAGLPVDPIATPTRASYSGSVLVAPAPAPTSDALLPDLMIRNVDGLRLDYGPPGDGNGYPFFPSLASPLYPGCTTSEHDETGATRCLRFSIAVGNDGAGPMLLTTDDVDPPFPTGDANVRAHQCVVDGNGGGALRDAGTATYSASHGHMHYDRILAYDLFAYDIKTGARLGHVAQGAKLGYGPWPEAMVHDGRRLAGDVDLPNPCHTTSWPSGLSAGWYDYYMWWRTSQYIDVGGVPDGVYELQVAFNPEGHVLESDLSNNAASVVLRLSGDTVTLLRPFAYAG